MIPTEIFPTGKSLALARPAEVRRAIDDAYYRRWKLLDDRQRDEGQLLRKAPFKIDLKRHEATSEERPLDLSPRDFTRLVYLMQKAPQVLFILRTSLERIGGESE